MKKLSILLLFAIMAIFQAQATTTTFTFSSLSLSSKQQLNSQDIESDGFQFIFTGGAYYYNRRVRFTQNSTLKILRKPTMAITKIKYICDPKDNPPKEASECKIKEGQGNVTLEGSTLIWTGCANIVHIENISSTTWRIISVEITYGETEVAAPTFSPEGGEYNEPQSVTIASATQGATISYSTDGGTTWATYQTPVAVTHGTTTIQAKATYNNTESKISTATYKIKPATVTLKDLMTQGSGAFDVADASMQAITRVEDKVASRYYVLVKDADGASIEKVEKAEGLASYKVNGQDQTAYDQSNWMLVEVSEQDYTAFYKENCSVSRIAGGLYNGDACNPVLSRAADGTMPVITYGDKGDQYPPNQYCPVNFMASYTSDYSGNGAQGSNGTATCFFMNPKAQEYATVVWAVWDKATSAFYVPAPDGVNNKLGFYGKFEVALDYNDGDVKDLNAVQDQHMYTFPAIVKKLTARQAAARKVNALTGGGTAQPGYIVYPLDLNTASGVVTAVSDVHSTKAVKRVSYYNLAGAKIATPQAGINIVVTTYNDGTTRATKMMK